MSQINEIEKAELGEMIKEYHKYDVAEKSAKKLREPLNLQLKSKMSKSGLEEFEFDGVVAKYSQQERLSMNEGKLIQKLKDLGFDEAIVQIEKPDAGKLEELIYEGKLDPALIAECNETKFVEVLSVKKSKSVKK